jgi:hypothetical protein
MTAGFGLLRVGPSISEKAPFAGAFFSESDNNRFRTRLAEGEYPRSDRGQYAESFDSQDE